ncbi:HEAT repeat domain-containing protein [Polymorphospora rubra]|uniref:HEAT repeat domain-containing protein n=1 Tax=Polymorphospora rubra TaxID=338584 RepID=UPI00340C35AF
MDDRLARIQAKLAALPSTEGAVLDPVLTEQQVLGFEDQHGIRLPEEFRQFVTRIGHGGYGPTYGLLPMDRWIPPRMEVHGKLAESFPFAPDAYVSAWFGGEGGPTFPFPGAITVVWGGCTQYTLLVVTGSGRGRLVEVIAGSDVVPHFHTDADFLAWYERWLDFTLAGHRDLTWFSHQMAGDEPELVDTLVNDAFATRRNAAAYTFITYPGPSASLLDVLAQALSTEPHPIVRKTILRALGAQGEQGRDLLPAALADPVPDVRRLAASLMTTNTRQGIRLSPKLRRTLADHLPVEDDRSVRDTIRWLLDWSHR